MRIACAINSSITTCKSLFIHQVGTHQCTPANFWGPYVRDHYLLHLVFSGKGVLKTEYNGIFSIEKNQGFLIFPGETCTYTADSQDPWHYGWIGFGGDDCSRVLNMLNLSSSKRVIRFENAEKIHGILKDLLTEYETNGNSFFTIAQMFTILHYLSDPAFIKKLEEINGIIEYIHEHFSSITVEELARTFGMSRSQLFRLFKKTIDTTPQQMIVQSKLDNAAMLLRTTDKTASEVCAEVGYQTPSAFTVQFHKMFNSPPIEYRKIFNDISFKYDQ